MSGPSGSLSAIPGSSISVTTPLRAAREIEQQLLEVCFQCRRKQIDRPSLYMLQCLHTACHDCLHLDNNHEYHCKCNRPNKKKNLIPVNKIFCRRGLCQQSLGCKKEHIQHCISCDFNVCAECVRKHLGHQTGPPKMTPSCPKHPKLPAKATCACGSDVCHPCSSGYIPEHVGHTKAYAYPAAKVIDSCERFNKGLLTLQSTTKNTFEMFVKEKNGLKNHFNKMRIDLARKSVEAVNTLMRKMNDCSLAIEMFETSYLQKFEESEREYLAKQAAIINFKKFCNQMADNSPLPEYLTFVSEVSSTLSNDVTNYTNKLVEAIKAYSHPPEFTFDMKPFSDMLSTLTKFYFQGQVVHPPVRTDPVSNLIEVPIDELAKNPRVDISAGRKQGEKRPGGPLKDAMDAKRARRDNEPSVTALVGTTINSFGSVPLVPPSMPLSSDMRPVHTPTANMPFHVRGYARLPEPPAHMRVDPRGNPKVPVNIPQAPMIPMRPTHLNRLPMAPALQVPTTMVRSGIPFNRPSMAHIATPPVSSPHVRQQLSSMPQRPLYPPIRTVQLPHGGASPPVSAGVSLQRAPIVPNVKTGPPNMQQALLDIIGKSNPSPPVARPPFSSSPIRPTVQTPPIQASTSSFQNISHNRIAPPATTPTGVMPPPPGSVSAGPPVTQPPAMPPIKLTLRRNPPGATISSDSPEKEHPFKADQWDDYCFVCNQGCDEISGELVCCDGCPKVYHNSCHIPLINGDVKDLPDDWRCTRCKNVPPITEITEKFTEREKLVCARVLLYCYEKKSGDMIQHSEPFHNPVPRSMKRYYELITNPICFKDIAKKITYFKYTNIQQFIDDMNLVFKNCCAFNRKGTPVELSARIVFDLYSKAVKSFLIPYHPKIWLYQNSSKPALN